LKLSREQAEAITILLNAPEFRIFMELIGTEGEKSMQVLIAAKGGLKGAQGRCQVYTEIVDAVATAKSTLESYQNSK